MIGILILSIGVWFDFGAFISGNPDVPLSWTEFIIPGAITATGAALIVYGFKKGKQVPSS
jgi:hypothetical protein